MKSTIIVNPPQDTIFPVALERYLSLRPAGKRNAGEMWEPGSPALLSGPVAASAAAAALLLPLLLQAQVQNGISYPDN